ncbi:MAG: hypothetical protein HBSAPP01_12360 [Candidatus Brocadia sapporoensis]|nr:MAG: hypothetical protein HBSAPP01_12360 [Candidatus Brocadia sapporoensis]
MIPVVIFTLFNKNKNKVICFMRGKIGEDLESLGHGFLSWFCIKIEKQLLRICDAVFCNGKDTALYVKQKLERNSIVLPNGVDFGRFANPKLEEENEWIRKIKGLKEQKYKIIVTVATLRDVKGIKYLIEAASYLQQENNGVNYRIIFVGKGDPTAYRVYGKNLGVEDNLLFVGEQKTVPSFLCLADVAVAISGGGGVSQAAVEMMAAGKPVIAWNNLTYSQLITHGKTGHLVKDRDSKALADGIEFIINNPDYAFTLSENAQKEASNYDWSVIADQFIKEFTKV